MALTVNDAINLLQHMRRQIGGDAYLLVNAEGKISETLDIQMVKDPTAASMPLWLVPAAMVECEALPKKEATAILNRVNKDLARLDARADNLVKRAREGLC